MHVRLKVGVQSALIAIGAIAMLYLALSYALNSQFAQIEAYTSQRDASRAVQALTVEEDQISVTALDYAAWDDSYNFIQHPTQDFIDSNFAHTTLNFDAILYISSTGTIVYSYSSDMDTQQPFTLPDTFIRSIHAPMSPYHFTSPSDSLEGVLMTSRGPLLFSALPITTSDRKSDVRGTLLMGKLLDVKELSRLSDIVKIPLTVVALTGPDASIFPDSWRSQTMPSDTLVAVPVTSDRMEIYSLIPDVYGQPAFALRSDLPRLTNIEGQRGLQYLFFALLAMGVVFAAFSILTIDRTIVHPIRRLAETVHLMESSHVIPEGEWLHRNDEIAELGQTFIRAFGALELSENRLRTDRERLDAILQSIGEAVVVVGKDRNVVLENRMAEQLSGYEFQEVLDKSYQKYFLFYNERDHSEKVDLIGRVLHGEAFPNTTTPLVYARKDGMIIPVACVSAALRDAAGHLIGAVIVFRDVTREREVDRMKSELVSIASHQLRTPLTGIKWVLELMLSGQSGKLTKDQKEQLEHIAESNERMIALVEDLLNVSHIETGRKFTYVFQKQDLMKTVRNVIDEQQVLAKAKDIELTLHRGSPKALAVTIDADKIHEVVANLISNAVKYTPKGGKVTVSVEQNAQGETIFHVKDTGIGIPVEQQKRVFERFFRADNAQQQEVNGTGLGLYIAKSIVEGHHGRIWFESFENKGSTFSFILPNREPTA